MPAEKIDEGEVDVDDFNAGQLVSGGGNDDDNTIVEDREKMGEEGEDEMGRWDGKMGWEMGDGRR